VTDRQTNGRAIAYAICCLALKIYRVAVNGPIMTGNRERSEPVVRVFKVTQYSQ